MRHLIGPLNIPDVTFHRPARLKEALALLNEHPDTCQLIAGGTDVIPRIRHGKLMLKSATNLIDLKGIQSLSDISVTDTQVTIGATASYTSIINSPVIAKAGSFLARVVTDIGSVQIRNSATIGGNIGTASPCGDASAGLLALDAEVVIARLNDSRTVPLKDFFTGFSTTVLKADEIVTAIRFPVMQPEDRWNWIKLGRRNAFTMSVISLAAKFQTHQNVFNDVKLAMGTVAPIPLRLTEVEDFLKNKEACAKVIAEAASLAAKSIQPHSSFRADAEYRRDMAQVLIRRALTPK